MPFLFLSTAVIKIRSESKSSQTAQLIIPSQIFICAKAPYINDPRIKSFEKYRVKSCQGEEVKTDMSDNNSGYVKVRVHRKSIGVIYNPISTLSKIGPLIGI